jgi:hypothetical protein
MNNRQVSFDQQPITTEQLLAKARLIWMELEWTLAFLRT